MKKTMISFTVMFALILIACGDSGGPTTPTQPTQPAVIPLNIHGSVTTFQVASRGRYSSYVDVNYIVTTVSNKAVTGCYVEVKWLDADGVQIDWCYAGVRVSFPEGTSTLTNQDMVRKETAAKIKDSRVVYSLCDW